MQLCLKPRGARGIGPKTFRTRSQLILSSDHWTTVVVMVHYQSLDNVSRWWLCCAVKLCMGESRDGLLGAWRFYDCLLNCSCTLWLLPFTLF